MSKTVKALVQGALFAAIYAVITLVIAPVSYGAIQCRLSDCLVLLCYRKKQYVYGYVVGTAIANIFSPLGIIDMFVGAFASLFMGIVFFWIKSKVLSISSGATIQGLIIGAELSIIYGLPYIETAAYVAVGGAIALAVGAIIYKPIMRSAAIKKITD